MMSDADPNVGEPLTPTGTGVVNELAASSSEPNEPVVDPWAVDEFALPAENEEAATSTETTEAISRLKESTSKLGSVLSSNTAALDQKLGISNVFNAFGSTVKSIDDDIKVSATVKSAGSSFGSWLTNSITAIDTKYQVSNKSKGIGSSISAAINEVVPPELIHNAYKSTSRGLSDFDEAHGITKVTAKTLAAGADLLAESLPAPATEKEFEAPAMRVDDMTFDDDGLPSSFVNKPTGDGP
jgi:hypothetical protein